MPTTPCSSRSASIPAISPGSASRSWPGQPYAPTATHEVMLGWRAADNFGPPRRRSLLRPGTWNTVTGIYRTGNSFGDAGAMFSLPARPGLQPGARAGHPRLREGRCPGPRRPRSPRRSITRMPELTTIRTAQQFGRADQGLVYLQAAVNGSTVLAILIGAVIVGNTMLLTLFERTREFGLLRAFGWTRRRTVSLLLGESFLLAFVGAVIGVALVVPRCSRPLAASGPQGRPPSGLHRGRVLAGAPHRARDDTARCALPDHAGRLPLTAQGVEP